MLANGEGVTNDDGQTEVWQKAQGKGIVRKSDVVYDHCYFVDERDQEGISIC